MSAAREHLAAVQRLISEAQTGLSSLDGLLDPAPLAVGAVPPAMRSALASVIRRLYGPMSQSEWSQIEAVLDGTAHVPGTFPKIGLTRADFEWAATAIPAEYAQIRAVDEVESGGGWYPDVRKTILDLDGPGGFLDGPALPKILFEAHHFDRLTNGRFRQTHPNVSSEKWNRSLYVGGQGEWERLYRAMQLNEEAALKSASVGRYQIMGFNFATAGFDSVRAFWDAQKESERRQLETFVEFIKGNSLGDELRQIDGTAINARPFAAKYNGKSYAVNHYDEKIATAYRKHS